MVSTAIDKKLWTDRKRPEMADKYQVMKDPSAAARCAETRTQQALMVVRIVFMLVGIVAMLLGMYFSTTFLDSIAAFFSILRYGRNSSYYATSCGEDKSAPVCASVEIAAAIVGTVDNIEEATDAFAETADSTSSGVDDTLAAGP